MIPRAHVTAWRETAPWSNDAQVEQDLVLSRTLIEIFNDPLLGARLAFRGATALHKLYLSPPARYSEDIDLVQVEAGPIGPLMTALHARLDCWLGEPRRKQSQGRMTFIYRFDSEIPPVTPLRLKVEVNTREHFTVFGLVRQRLAVDNPWFAGEAVLLTYSLEELLSTKLRALYQRKEGRDLFDLAAALVRRPELDADKRSVVSASTCRKRAVGFRVLSSRRTWPRSWRTRCFSEVWPRCCCPWETSQARLMRPRQPNPCWPIL